MGRSKILQKSVQNLQKEIVSHVASAARAGKTSKLTGKRAIVQAIKRHPADALRVHEHEKKVVRTRGLVTGGVIGTAVGGTAAYGIRKKNKNG